MTTQSKSLPDSPPGVSPLRPDSALDLLRRRVWEDPSLQSSLFEIHDPGEFRAAVSRLAETLGRELGDEELGSAMQHARREWFERHLP